MFKMLQRPGTLDALKCFALLQNVWRLGFCSTPVSQEGCGQHGFLKAATPWVHKKEHLSFLNAAISKREGLGSKIPRNTQSSSMSFTKYHRFGMVACAFEAPSPVRPKTSHNEAKPAVAYQ